jgi:hypothetical protein
VVIRDLDVVCIAILPSETNAVLVVDTNAVLTRAISLQPFYAVAGRNCQLQKLEGSIDLV